ncbi:MAG: T9SS type A sorting domain-containing protein, partial [Bacteroidota bacterium]
DYRYHIAHQLVGYGEANFQLDAAVVNIIAPNNSAAYTRVGTICANPRITIRNTGATDLTELTINYWLNDAQTPQSYQWTGNLGFMEEKVVEIPSTAELWFDMQGDNNRFFAEVLHPNQGTDEYAFNNQMQAKFDIPEVLPRTFTIETRTNNNHSENSYQMYRGDGSLVRINGLASPNTTFTDNYVLPPGCYRLEFKDLGGDGIQWWANPNQGTGYVRILDENGDGIKTFESDFGGGFIYNFTTDFALPVEEVNFLTSIKVFPNPAEDVCTLEAEDLSRAEIRLTNVSGQQVYAPVLSRTATSVSFDLGALSAGVYLISIQNGEVRTSRKVMVK